DIRDAPDREHDPDVAGLEVVNDGLGHADGNSLRRCGVRRVVQQPEGMDEAEDHEIDRGTAVAAVDDPVVLLVEVRHVPDAGPGAGVAAAVPGTVHGDGRGGGLACEQTRDHGEPSQDRRHDRLDAHDASSSSWHSHGTRDRASSFQAASVPPERANGKDGTQGGGGEGPPTGPNRKRILACAAGSTRSSLPHELARPSLPIPPGRSPSYGPSLEPTSSRLIFLTRA